MTISIDAHTLYLEDFECFWSNEVDPSKVSHTPYILRILSAFGGMRWIHPKLVIPPIS